MTDAEMLAAIRKVPPEVMRELSKVALREATQTIARQLSRLADDPSAMRLTGRETLEAAVATIWRTNAKVWGGSA